MLGVRHGRRTFAATASEGAPIPGVVCFGFNARARDDRTGRDWRFDFDGSKHMRIFRTGVGGFGVVGRT